MSDTQLSLFEMARASLANAYAPYSKFHVGACLRSHDQFFTGCNIENVSYGLTQCAEAVAIGCMVASGYKSITEIAITSSSPHICMPCGACRQRIAEFAQPSTKIYLLDASGHTELTLNELYPYPFNANTMENP